MAYKNALVKRNGHNPDSKSAKAREKENKRYKVVACSKCRTVNNTLYKKRQMVKKFISVAIV